MALRSLSNRVKIKTTAHVLHCKTKIFGMLGPINNKNNMWSSSLFFCTKSTNPILHYYQNVKPEDYTPLLDYDGDVNFVTRYYNSEEAKSYLKVMSYAQFAVDEHNKRKNSTLKLVSVFGAEADSYGTNYQIALETTDADKKAYYLARVHGPGLSFSELSSNLMPVQDPLSEEYTHRQLIDDFVDFNYILEELVKGVVVCMDAENDDRMKRLAHFAIERYNKKEDASLEFVSVIGAMTKYLNFIYYDSQVEACDVWRYITLEAIDNGKQGTYRAKIWKNKPMSVHALMELKLVDGALYKNY